jgi:hypothetical protein
MKKFLHDHAYTVAVEQTTMVRQDDDVPVPVGSEEVEAKQWLASSMKTFNSIFREQLTQGVSSLPRPKGLPVFAPNRNWRRSA